MPPMRSTDDLHPTFPVLLQRFFVGHLRQQRAVSNCTVAAYRDTFKLLLQFAEARIGKSPTKLSLCDLNSTLILAFLDHLEKDRGNSVRSRNARLAAIRTFLKYAAHHDLSSLGSIERNLAIPMKRHDKPILGFLTRPEMDAIIAAPDVQTWAGRRDRAMFTLLYNTGARVSEVIGVRAGDIVLDVAPVVHLFGKGRKHRSIPLWKSTAVLLKAWLRELDNGSDSSFLFPSSLGRGKLSRSSVTQRLALATEQAAKTCPGLGRKSVSPHTIRHTTAMHLLQAGVDITVIALWLGHESPVTTGGYLEADLAMKEKALSSLQPAMGKPSRYQPPDQLMAFLQTL
jgi:site-specific recombinase XerD